MNPYRPLVSVMIPTYNQEKYISQAILSVLRQSYQNIEIIVSDDSPNDSTKKIVLEKFKECVRYVQNIPAKGRTKNYHYMLYELAKGDWIINLDGDDYFCDDQFIDKAIQLVNKYPEIVLVFSKQMIYNERTQQYVKHDYPLQGELLMGNWLFLNNIFQNIDIPHLASMYNRKKAIEIGFYESDTVSSDRESLLKLLLNHKIAFLNTFAGVWRHHESNQSKNISVEDFASNLTVYDGLCTYAMQYSSISPRVLWGWKLLAKYKLLFSQVSCLLEEQNILSVKNMLKKIFFTNMPLLLFLLIDIRLYKRIFKVLIHNQQKGWVR